MIMRSVFLNGFTTQVDLSVSQWIKWNSDVMGFFQVIFHGICVFPVWDFDVILCDF